MSVIVLRLSKFVVKHCTVNFLECEDILVTEPKWFRDNSPQFIFDTPSYKQYFCINIGGNNKCIQNFGKHQREESLG
jgi:hypothetical protein